jgi:hypothetical protein
MQEHHLKLIIYFVFQDHTRVFFVCFFLFFINIFINFYTIAFAASLG